MQWWWVKIMLHGGVDHFVHVFVEEEEPEHNMNEKYFCCWVKNYLHSVKRLLVLIAGMGRRCLPWWGWPCWPFSPSISQDDRKEEEEDVFDIPLFCETPPKPPSHHHHHYSPDPKGREGSTTPITEASESPVISAWIFNSHLKCIHYKLKEF
jgi:hypothetical protein